MVLGVAVALGRQGRRRSQRSDESESSSPQRTTASVIDSWHRARRDASIPSPRTPLKTRTTEQIASPTTGPPPPQPARSRTPRRGRTSCDADESAEGAAAAPSLIGIEHWQPALLEHFDHIRAKRFVDCTLSRTMKTTEVGVGMGSTEFVYQASSCACVFCCFNAFCLSIDHETISRQWGCTQLLLQYATQNHFARHGHWVQGPFCSGRRHIISTI